MATADQYSEPYVVPPLQLPHRQSLIILHGRGDNGPNFGARLLLWQPLGASTTTSTTLRELLPHAAFIFPSAALRRSTLWEGMIIRQWFDVPPLTAPNAVPQMLVEGLRESTALVQGLVRDEIQKVGAENVVVGGLSQGCATMLATMILNSGAPRGASSEVPAAYFGMCGWLPFAEHIEHEMRSNIASEVADNGSAPDPSSMEIDRQDKSNITAARSMLRSQLNLPAPGGEEVDIMRPVFMGHGCMDNVISVDLGRQAARCIGELNMNLQWQEYEFLRHWYSEEMLYDILKFLRTKLGWKMEGWVEKSETIQSGRSVGTQIHNHV